MAIFDQILAELEPMRPCYLSLDSQVFAALQCHTHPISTGPHLQRGGLHRQLLENAYQGAARAHALQLVRPHCACCTASLLFTLVSNQCDVQALQYCTDLLWRQWTACCMLACNHTASRSKFQQPLGSMVLYWASHYIDAERRSLFFSLLFFSTLPARFKTLAH